MNDADDLLEQANRLRSFAAELNFAPWRDVLVEAASELVAEAERSDDRIDQVVKIAA